MKNQQTPALTKALSFIRHSIKTGIWPNGTRIPPYAHLAKEVGVSARTMLKVIRIAEEEGLLFARPKRGIYIGKPSADTHTNEKLHTSKWETVKNLIHDDIMTGIFHDQTFLPSIKELMGFYETGYVVVKKAIDALVKEKLIVPHKRTYRIEHFVSRASSRQSICFIGHPKVLSGISAEYESTWIQSFVRALEKECSAKNFSFSKFPFTTSPKCAPELESVLGFIIWFTADIIVEFPSGKEIIEFVRFLSKYKKPIALFNLVGVRDFEIYSNFFKPGIINCPVFLSDFNRDFLAGVTVGRFLLSKGYKKVSYFAPDHTHLYAQERFRGIVDAFSSVGIKNTVVPFYLTEYASAPPDIKTAPIALENTDALLSQKSEDLDHVITFLKSKMIKSAYHEDKVIKHIEQLKEWLELRMTFTPIFEKALATTDTCAWVCSSDMLAIYAAMEFLHAKKIKIPTAIGLVGFDDSSPALLNSLTSYHFNLSATARRMINLIIYSKTSASFLAANRENPGVFEVDGMVIDRGSV